MNDKINNDEIELLKHSFHSISNNNNSDDDSISKTDFINYLIKKGYPTTFACKIFERLDLHHHHSRLTFDDYCMYMHHSRLEHKQVFNKIAKKGKNTISHDDLRDGLKYLHLEPKDVDVDELFVKIHHSNSGEITFDEFEDIFGMLNLDDISYLYHHHYSMFDGGSASLLADYRKLLNSIGITSTTTTSSSNSKTQSGQYDMFLRMITAGISGGIAQTAVNPFETIKVRLQNEGTAAIKKYKTFLNCSKVIFLEEVILLQDIYP